MLDKLTYDLMNPSVIVAKQEVLASTNLRDSR